MIDQKNTFFIKVFFFCTKYDILLQKKEEAVVTIEEQIYEFAKKRHLEAGITTAEPFSQLYPVLSQKAKELEGFVEKDINKRIDPKLTMKDAKSIIVLAMGYGYRKKKAICQSTLTGEFSIAAVATDYHTLLKAHLKELAFYLEQKIPDFKAMAFVDTGPLVDRAVAIRAGLGWLGKNGSVHTSKFGSLAFFGYLLTNLSLDQKNAVIGSCNACQCCIDNCPTGALSKNMFHMKKCISYLTQTKTILPIEMMKTMGNQLYGCDICQVVCPKNQKALSSFTEVETTFSLEALLHCSNKIFSEKIGKTASGWRGKKILQRNALIALANSKSKQALPLLEEALQDKRPLIRQTAVRAIFILQQPEGVLLLEKAEKTEQEYDILQEIQHIKNQLKAGE